jgi:hypothetical protein
LDSQGRVVAVGGPSGIVSARFRDFDNLPANRDADRVNDREDRCPGRFNDAFAGCPSYAQSLAIRTTRKVVRGSLGLENQGCLKDNETVTVLASRPGRDHRLAKVPVRGNGKVLKFKAHVHAEARTRVYATIAKRFDPTVGSCRHGRSRRIPLGG